MQFYPNYPIIGHLTILLKPSNKGFIKKHKILILCQSGNNENIESDSLTGVNMKFQLSTQTMRQTGFIVNDSLIVGVEINLES